jgi:hypothetical protein
MAGTFKLRPTPLSTSHSHRSLAAFCRSGLTGVLRETSFPWFDDQAEEALRADSSGHFLSPAARRRRNATAALRTHLPPTRCRKTPVCFVLDMQGPGIMRYAILCYHSEDIVGSWTKEEDDACMARLMKVQEKLAAEGRLGPVARLLPTTAATTLRKDRDGPLVIDGPFAETKEQLLGFYVVDCDALDEVLDIARELAAANPGGAYEIRPIGIFHPWTVPA